MGRPLHRESPVPLRDIDVLVVGNVDLRSVRRACRAVERDLHVDVNPVVIDRSRWVAKKPEPFIAQIKSQPLVPIRLERP